LPDAACRCTTPIIQRISGPSLHRIDMHVDVQLVDDGALAEAQSGESSNAIRQRVEKAREVQAERFKGHQGVHTNGTMTPRLTKKYYDMDAECVGLMDQAMGEISFSARTYDLILTQAPGGACFCTF
jgi:magnesium chelatase family protein